MRSAAILFICTFISVESHAQSLLYDWTAICSNNSAFSGSGTLTIDSSDSMVTQITGKIGTTSISSIYSGGGFSYDNACQTSQPYLDSSGVAFTTASYLYILSYAGSQYELSGVQFGTPYGIPPHQIATLDSFSIESVPEPTTVALFFVGGVAVFLWRRRAWFAMLPNKSPEPTAVGAVRSAIAAHAASRRWLSFFR
jgi:hypothetical protein